MTFEPRLHLSPKRLTVFDPSLVEPQRILGKPRGLWYACGDEWMRWVKSDAPSWVKELRYAYEIDVNLRSMLVIRTVKQLDAFNAKYASVRRFDEWTALQWIDWPRVASKYAGIEICPHQDSRRTTWDWYHDFDIASGCIWSSEAIRGITEVDLP